MECPTRRHALLHRQGVIMPIVTFTEVSIGAKFKEEYEIQPGGIGLSVLHNRILTKVGPNAAQSELSIRDVLFPSHREVLWLKTRFDRFLAILY